MGKETETSFAMLKRLGTGNMY